MVRNIPPHSLVSNPQRVIALDVLRILLALWILLYHSMVHLHCDYGFFNIVIKHQTIPMTLFFMLSGYSLQIVYGKKSTEEGWKVKPFYAKRAIAIWPLYMVCTLLMIIMNVVAGYQTIVDNIILFPVEILGIQSIFPGSLFEYASNSGTWFISCLFISYSLFPVLAKIVNMKSNLRWLLLLCLISLWLYITIIGRKFDVQFMYTNPMVRSLEFLIGMAVAKNFESRPAQVMPLLKPLVYVSNLSLALFLGQGFVLLPLKYVFKYNILPFEFSNQVLIIVVIISAYIVAILFHEMIEKPSKRMLQKKLFIVR